MTSSEETPQHDTGDGETAREETREDRRSARADEIEAKAARLGGMVGRFARRFAADARPEAERAGRLAAERARLAAQHGLAAAQAARPHVERAAGQARGYVHDHDDEIRRAARVAASLAATRAVPLPLRPIVDAASQELRRPPLRVDPPVIPPNPEVTPAPQADESER
ncbi:MAG: hypothetical protein WD734_04040 [Dehalococcoidia bacterium]